MACKTTSSNTTPVQDTNAPQAKNVGTLPLSQINVQTLQLVEPDSQKPINIMFNSQEDAQTKCAQLAAEGCTCTLLSPDEADADLNSTNKWLIETDNAPTSLGLADSSNSKAQENTAIIAGTGGAIMGVASIAIAALAIRSHYRAKNIEVDGLLGGGAKPRPEPKGQFEPESKGANPKKPETPANKPKPIPADKPAVVARVERPKFDQNSKDPKVHSDEAYRLANAGDSYLESAERRTAKIEIEKDGPTLVKLKNEAGIRYHSSAENYMQAARYYVKAAELTDDAAQKAIQYRNAVTKFTAAKNAFSNAAQYTEDAALKSTREALAKEARNEVAKYAAQAKGAGS